MSGRGLRHLVPGSWRGRLILIRQWLRWMPTRTPFHKRLLLADPSFSTDERALLDRVSTRIYRHDTTYDTAAHYYRVGLSAIQRINEAVERAGITRVRSVLDLPCGSGRVLRFLAQRFPDAEITACELEPGPVEFCARTFGARPALSSVNLDEVSLPRTFDLIWCGSLVTHLNDKGIPALLGLFRRSLADGGLMIFTTHGACVHRRLSQPAPEMDYGLTQEQIERIGTGYTTTGYGFERSSASKDYGVSLTSPEWIRARVRDLGGFREVLFHECGWGNHQDVFAFVREH